MLAHSQQDHDDDQDDDEFWDSEATEHVDLRAATSLAEADATRAVLQYPPGQRPAGRRASASSQHTRIGHTDTNARTSPVP